MGASTTAIATFLTAVTSLKNGVLALDALAAVYPFTATSVPNPQTLHATVLTLDATILGSLLSTDLSATAATSGDIYALENAYKDAIATVKQRRGAVRIGEGLSYDALVTEFGSVDP